MKYDVVLKSLTNVKVPVSTGVDFTLELVGVSTHTAGVLTKALENKLPGRSCLESLGRE